VPLGLRGRVDRPWRFFAIVIVIVIAGLFYADLLAFQSSTRQVDQARQFVRQTNAVLSSVKDAETGERGYVLTGDRKSRAPYEFAIRALPGELSALAGTAAQARRNQRDVAHIQSLVETRLRGLKLAVEAREQGSEGAALVFARSEDGQLIMDEVRTACAMLTSAETASLYERTRIAEQHADRSRVVVFAGCLCLVFLLFRLGTATDAVVSAREEFASGAQESRRLLQLTLASIGDAVIVTDAGGSVRFINPVAEKLTGWRVAEAAHCPIGTVFSVVRGETRALIPNPFETIKQTGKAQPLPEDSLLVSRDGQRNIPIEDSSAAIRNREGELLGSIIVFRDVSARRAAEKELERWKEIFSGAGFGMFVIDPVSAAILDMNATFVSLHGYSGNELLGKQLDTLVAPSCRGELAHAIALATQQGRYMFEHRHVRRDGAEFASLIDMTTFRDGGREYLAGYCSDVTERAQFEEALRESEARFRTLASALPQLIWSTDADGRIEYVNEGWTSYAGWPVAGLADFWSELLHPEEKDEHLRLWQKSLQSGDVFESQARLRSGADSSYRWFLCRAVAVRDREGHIIRWLGGCTDVQQQLESATRLKRTNEALERSNADLEQFAYAASHDLQEPLRMVSLYSELLKQEFGHQLDERASSYLDIAMTGAHRMSTLLKALLTYARASGGSGSEAEPDTPQIVDSKAAFDLALQNLSSVIVESGAKIHCGPLPFVSVRAIHLVQLFQNLIGNAIKYRKTETSEALVAIIRAEAYPPNQWLFSVCDNGMGIEPQYLGQIFGLFKRLHGQTIEGTGIGLSLCQKIVERAGGRIWAESEMDKGSTFFFTLPGSGTDL
jgi:PAS domain S-box-containing protein